jgi:hypothetical protein
MAADLSPVPSDQGPGGRIASFGRSLSGDVAAQMFGEFAATLNHADIIIEHM